MFIVYLWMSLFISLEQKMYTHYFTVPVLATDIYYCSTFTYIKVKHILTVMVTVNLKVDYYYYVKTETIYN